jgi:hypothetical protein
MTQQRASPPDVYSIAVMTKSSSKVGNLLTGQISHHNIYYGQIVLLRYRKANSKTARRYARPKFPGVDRAQVTRRPIIKMNDTINTVERCSYKTISLM